MERMFVIIKKDIKTNKEWISEVIKTASYPIDKRKEENVVNIVEIREEEFCRFFCRFMEWLYDV